MLDTDTIDWARVRRQRQRGRPWTVIARELGISTERLRRRCDPEYHERRLAQERQQAELHGSNWADTTAAIRPPDLPDTRSLTARLLGDPLPGRSALDQRQGKAWWRG